MLLFFNDSYLYHVLPFRWEMLRFLRPSKLYRVPIFSRATTCNKVVDQSLSVFHCAFPAWAFSSSVAFSVFLSADVFRWRDSWGSLKFQVVFPGFRRLFNITHGELCSSLSKYTKTHKQFVVYLQYYMYQSVGQPFHLWRFDCGPSDSARLRPESFVKNFFRNCVTWLAKNNAKTHVFLSIVPFLQQRLFDDIRHVHSPLRQGFWWISPKHSTQRQIRNKMVRPYVRKHNVSLDNDEISLSPISTLKNSFANKDRFKAGTKRKGLSQSAETWVWSTSNSSKTDSSVPKSRTIGIQRASGFFQFQAFFCIKMDGKNAYQKQHLEKSGLLYICASKLSSLKNLNFLFASKHFQWNVYGTDTIKHDKTVAIGYLWRGIFRVSIFPPGWFLFARTFVYRTGTGDALAP